MDLKFFQFLHSFAGKSWFLDKLVIFFGSYLAYFLIFVAILLFLSKKNWRKRFFIFCLFLLSAIISRGIITEIIRFFYFRQRPFIALNFSPLISHSSTASFPSGHMAFYFVLALSIYLLSRKWGWFFIGSVFLMGLARVASGVHWPSDILGGILIAGFSYLFVLKILFSKTRF